MLIRHPRAWAILFAVVVLVGSLVILVEIGGGA